MIFVCSILNSMKYLIIKKQIFIVQNKTLFLKFIYSLNFRFSLIHLEPGEFFFENYACVYKRGDTQNIATTWRRHMVDSTVSGKLKVF